MPRGTNANADEPAGRPRSLWLLEKMIVFHDRSIQCKQMDTTWLSYDILKHSTYGSRSVCRCNDLATNELSKHVAPLLRILGAVMQRYGVLHILRGVAGVQANRLWILWFPLLTRRIQEDASSNWHL